MLVLCLLEYLKLNSRRERGESHFFIYSVIKELGEFLNSEVKIEGYVHQMRKLKYVIFIVLRECRIKNG